MFEFINKYIGTTKEDDSLIFLHGKKRVPYLIKKSQLQSFLEVDDITTDINDLKNKTIKVSYWQIIDISSSTSGSITIPTGATIQENEFGNSGTAVLSTLTGSSKPTFESPRTGSGSAITASLDTSGNYISSSTYASPVAIIFTLTIKLDELDNLTEDNIIDFYLEAAQQLQNLEDVNVVNGPSIDTYLLSYDNATSKWIALDPSDVGQYINHQDLIGAGTNTHTDIDNHIGNSSIHFTEGSIDHDNIQNNGTNTHAQIDTHIADDTKHRQINDSGTATTDLFSASKILSLLSALEAGAKPVESCVVSTQADGNINLSSAPATIDSVTPSNGDRICVSNQSILSENGIYTYNGAASAMTRTTDFDGTPSNEVSDGRYTLIKSGTYQTSVFMVVNSGSIINVGVDDITFDIHPNIAFGTIAGTAAEGNDSRFSKVLASASDTTDSYLFDAIGNLTTGADVFPVIVNGGANEQVAFSLAAGRRVETQSSDPTVNSDSASYYSVGSFWWNTSTEILWLCKDNSVGAAVWEEVGATGGSAKHVAATTLSSWTLDSGDIYYADFAHNLGTKDLGVHIYNTANDRTVGVHEIERTSTNNVRIYIQGNTASLRVVVWDAIFGIQTSSTNIVKNPTTPYSPNDGETIIWDCTAGDKIVSLPAAASSNNFKITVKKIDSSANTITLDPNGSEEIDEDSAGVIVNGQYDSITIECSGTGWWITSQY